MTVELLTEQYLELLSLKGGCIGSSESTLVKMPQGGKSHVAANLLFLGSLFIIQGYTWYKDTLCVFNEYT